MRDRSTEGEGIRFFTFSRFEPGYHGQMASKDLISELEDNELTKGQAYTDFNCF